VFESESLPLPLSLPPQYSNSRRQRIAGVYLSQAAIEEFNGILRAVNDDAPKVDADQVISLGRWLQSLPAKTAHATVQQRIARVESDLSDELAGTRDGETEPGGSIQSSNRMSASIWRQGMLNHLALRRLARERKRKQPRGGVSHVGNPTPG